MTSPPVYTEVAQVADTHIQRAIDSLAIQVRDGFDSVNKRIDRVEEKFDKVVTQGEFSATVARLDGKIEHTDERLKVEVRKVGERVDRAGTTTKWAIGLGLTGAGLLSGVIFGIVANLS